MARHALVIGAGLLRDVALAMARGGWSVTLVGPNRRRLLEIAAKAPDGNIYPLVADVEDREGFEVALVKAASTRGAFEIAVAWTDDDALEPLIVAAEFVYGQFFHVLGASDANPRKPPPRRRPRFEAFQGLSYHEVVLGWVNGQAGARWLTHREGTHGILRAMQTKRPRTVVGMVTPWTSRP